MTSFDGTVLSQATTTGTNCTGPRQQRDITQQHTSGQIRHHGTTSSPPSSDGACRRLQPPAILCKVFVQGIGWGSQVCFHHSKSYLGEMNYQV